MLYMSFIISSLFSNGVATLWVCSPLERNRMRSSFILIFVLRGWSKPIHHALLFDWYFVSIPGWWSERRVHRSKKCSLTICLCIFPHSLGLHIIWYFFFLGLLQRMTRVVPSQKFNMCVWLSIRNTVMVNATYMHNRRPRRAFFLFNSDPVSHWVIVAVFILSFIFPLRLYTPDSALMYRLNRSDRKPSCV